MTTDIKTVISRGGRSVWVGLERRQKTTKPDCPDRDEEVAKVGELLRAIHDARLAGEHAKAHALQDQIGDML